MKNNTGQMPLVERGFLLWQFWSSKLCRSEYNKIMETKNHSHTDQYGWQEYV